MQGNVPVLVLFNGALHASVEVRHRLERYDMVTVGRIPSDVGAVLDADDDNALGLAGVGASKQGSELEWDAGGM